MPRFPKPPEGSWTEHHPELGTGLIMVSLPVEVWKQPGAVDAGTAFFERTIDPGP